MDDGPACSSGSRSASSRGPVLCFAGYRSDAVRLLPIWGIPRRLRRRRQSRGVPVRQRDPCADLTGPAPRRLRLRNRLRARGVLLLRVGPVTYPRWPAWAWRSAWVSWPRSAGTTGPGADCSLGSIFAAAFGIGAVRLGAPKWLLDPCFRRSRARRPWSAACSLVLQRIRIGSFDFGTVAAYFRDGSNGWRCGRPRRGRTCIPSVGFYAAGAGHGTRRCDRLGGADPPGSKGSGPAASATTLKGRASPTAPPCARVTYLANRSNSDGTHQRRK